MAASHQAVGLHCRTDDYYEVGREKVREFATAVSDCHPAHHDENAAAALGYHGLIAPITFASIIGIAPFHRLITDERLGLDPSQCIQTDQRIVVHRPIQVGDRLSYDVSVDSFRSIPDGAIVVFKAILTDQDGELVQTGYSTVIGRAARTSASAEGNGAVTSRAATADARDVYAG